MPLTGGMNYKLNLPNDVPSANIWSLPLYEAKNAAGLANGQLTEPALLTTWKPGDVTKMK